MELVSIFNRVMSPFLAVNVFGWLEGGCHPSEKAMQGLLSAGSANPDPTRTLTLGAGPEASP